MTKYQEELIKFYTKDWRKPVFIENAFYINEDTPINDILYTYNEMASRGYLLEERFYFLENAQINSKKDSFCFLYPDVILPVAFEKHPFVIEMEKLIQKYKDSNQHPSKKEFEEVYKLKDY